jgi:hypothetical protein
MAKVEQLMDIDVEDFLDSEEMDNVRAVLTYILIHNTDLDMDTIYSIVFRDGGNITWH